MDLNELILTLVASGGGVAVIAAGLWALTRPSGSDTDGKEAPEKDAKGERKEAAKPERPAAPTWGESLSAPAKKPAREAESEEEEGADASQAPVDAEVPHEGGVQASDTPEATPAAPVAPAETVEPVEPVAPVEPVETAEPVDPVEPVEPAEPVAPAEEVEQADVEAEPHTPVEAPEPTADRMVRLRERLQRSGSIGRGILALLTSGEIDMDTWDEIEETLLMADLGPDATDELMEALRERVQVLGTKDPDAIREVLREELVKLVNPGLDRRLAASAIEAPDGSMVPSVVMMVGVNGTGKTTTTGKFGRVLIAEGRTVLFGAADTFRAAAAEQLQTWGERVGVTTVRSERENADPASVAFDAVQAGIDQGVDVVVIDTAGRLQNKKGLMDELGKIRRVASKALKGAEIQEVILVLDATTGQNGMQQARVFAEAVNVTGIALTKLDGTAKGGIVVNVQRELGVPVKLVGLGEGMDDLTPFDPYGFVDALLE
ncbi:MULTISPECIES: signal recognition particle-docking protein FtsY [Dermabacter]|uniref:signal recognition particle-docking protein FtsY n=1 Tax=Dermabacter TaxID=36739 RepID=UPI000773B287|nr:MULTISPECIES: signal recognition particle-docking protein FtsY [Dermabacter]MCT1955807.1 signal recognition particle-docking protein FtsY [Dermabacter hominis]MDU1463732.1 signal recognition particle-docking protein FtsY [Dermabacter sp.]